MTSDERRLHPAAVGAEALDGLRQMLVPLVVLVVVGGGRSLASLLVLGAAGLLVSTGVALVVWQNTRWSVRDGSVRLRRGVLRERVTTVPFDRVQAIDTVRGPVQRLFGVVELHVQTAGGGKAGEIVLKAVTPHEAADLREVVRAGAAQPDAAEASSGAPTWALGRGPLVLAGLTSASLAVLVPVVAGLSQVLDDVLGAEDAERLLPDTLGGAALLAVAVLALAWVLSFAGTIVAFGGFAVTRDGERLRIRRGIVERREASVPVARVHAVRLVESPLREPFGLAQLRIETAGYAAEAASAQTLLPLVRRRDVAAVLDRLLPELAGSTLEHLRPPPARARRRFVAPPVAAGALPAAALVAWLGVPGLAALALPALGALLGLARFRAAGFALAGDRLVTRRRVIARTTAVADARRLQHVGDAVTVLQRRARLADLRVAVSSGTRLTVRHLDAAAVDDALGRLVASAAGRG